jgi:hypothetical protein
VSLEDYRSGRDLIEAHAEEADFEGERPEEMVERAEATLGRAFPPSRAASARSTSSAARSRPKRAESECAEMRLAASL